MLRSVRVTEPSPGEQCDLCDGRADVRVTNGKFFILITCRRCWNELTSLVSAGAL